MFLQREEKRRRDLGGYETSLRRDEASCGHEGAWKESEKEKQKKRKDTHTFPCLPPLSSLVVPTMSDSAYGVWLLGETLKTGPLSNLLCGESISIFGPPSSYNDAPIHLHHKGGRR